MTRLCSVHEVPEGSAKRIEVEGRDAVAVYRLNGRYYATADECTHAGASLSEGVVDGEIIECPLHGGAFHVPTGRPTDLPCTLPLTTYAVRVDGEDLYADLGLG